MPTPNLKCNWCHKRFTLAELEQQTRAETDGVTHDAIVVCTHAWIGMKFHPDCYELHVAKTH